MENDATEEEDSEEENKDLDEEIPLNHHQLKLDDRLFSPDSSIREVESSLLLTRSFSLVAM